MAYITSPKNSFPHHKGPPPSTISSLVHLIKSFNGIPHNHLHSFAVITLNQAVNDNVIYNQKPPINFT